MRTTLDIEDAERVTAANALDPKACFTGAPRLSRRHRVRDNLLGRGDYCPIIRRTETLEAFLRRGLAQKIQEKELHQGLETEKIFASLILANLSADAATIQATEVGATLEDRDRRLLFEILFEDSSELTQQEADSCLEALQHRRAERELADVQRSIEANPAGPELRNLLVRKQELMKRLAASR